MEFFCVFWVFFERISEREELEKGTERAVSQLQCRPRRYKAFGIGKKRNYVRGGKRKDERKGIRNREGVWDEERKGKRRKGNYILSLDEGLRRGGDRGGAGTAIVYRMATAL
jgi:hypothetical protein